MLAFFQRNYIRYKDMWLKKSPLEKWDFLCSVGKFVLHKVGVRTLTTCEITWWTYSSFVMMISYVILSSYTVYYFTSRDRVFDGLKCLCLSGTCIGVPKQFINHNHPIYWNTKENGHFSWYFINNINPLWFLGIHRLLPKHNKSPFHPTQWLDIWS